MSEGEVEGGFPAQQEKPKPAPKHNHKTTSWKWNRKNDLLSGMQSMLTFILVIVLYRT